MKNAIDVDAILRGLTADLNLSGVLCASFLFNDGTVEIRIDPDGSPFEECVSTARKLLLNLDKVNSQALSLASKSELENFNDDWRVKCGMQSDGTYRDIERPYLTRTEFEALIKLTSVGVVGSMIEFCYSDDDLFAGHSIFVTSFDGLEFSDTDVQLFG